MDFTQLQIPAIQAVFKLSIESNSGLIVTYSASKIILLCSLTFKPKSIIRAQQIREYLYETNDHIIINTFGDHESSSCTTILTDEPIVSAGFALDGVEMFVGFSDGIMLLTQKHDQWLVNRFVHVPKIDIIGVGVITIKNMSRLYFIYTIESVVLINPDNESFKILSSGLKIKSVVTSNKGSKLAVLVDTGECLVFDVLHVFYSIASKPLPSAHALEFVKLQEKIVETIPRLRLINILREYREFPKKHRSIIWKSLLKLPENIAEFDKIMKLPSHPCTDLYYKTFPLKDTKMARNLSRVVSCLAYWCPALAITNFTPLFVFPFLIVFGSDTLRCFETIATIILNYGQLWFEFVPLEPMNYLGLVDNLIGHVDPQLKEFYRSKNIPSSVYSWSLIQSAFTEVLSTEQWLSFWDHILIQPPYFIVFCLVAINVSLESVIQRLNTISEIEEFFADRISAIDINKVLHLAAELMVTCPAELHPVQYFHPFRSLAVVQYRPSFVYPRLQLNKIISNISSNNSDAQIRTVNKCNEKLIELEKMKQSIESLFDNESKLREHGMRLEMVNRVYTDGVRNIEQSIGK